MLAANNDSTESSSYRAQKAFSIDVIHEMASPQSHPNLWGLCTISVHNDLLIMLGQGKFLDPLVFVLELIQVPKTRVKSITVSLLDWSAANFVSIHLQILLSTSDDKTRDQVTGSIATIQVASIGLNDQDFLFFVCDQMPLNPVLVVKSVESPCLRLRFLRRKAPLQPHPVNWLGFVGSKNPEQKATVPFSEDETNQVTAVWLSIDPVTD
jgi:hypothetical protein